jgi:hypothetical protein
MGVAMVTGMSVPAPPVRAEILRSRVLQAIKHGTALIADLKALTEAFEPMLPDLADRPETQRWAEVARITSLDVTIPDDLAALVETLADVLAGVSWADGGEAWLEHQRARLNAGEDPAAA